MLAAGRPNQAIAGEPVDTVNKHGGHVLAKLGAANAKGMHGTEHVGDDTAIEPPVALF